MTETSGAHGLAANGSKPKHALLAEVLESEVRAWEPGTAVPAVTALMKRFGVSQGTVVHALRHLRTRGLVTRPTGKKRLVAVGRPASSKAVLSVLLLRSQWSSPDYDAMSYALLEEATRQRLHLETLPLGPGLREDVAASIKSHDAVVLMPSSTDSPNVYSLVEESRLPSVMLWEDPPVPGMMCVADDDVAMGRMAVEHLRALGHRKVVAFLSEPARAVMTRRLAGWEQAMRGVGEKHPERLVIDCSVLPGKDSIVGSYEKLRRWLFQNGNRLPGTAVFCLCWTGALGMLRALREVGLEVPRDVSILSHGGENRLCEFTNPALSVIQSEVSDFAREALDLIKAACLGNPPQKTAILLQPTIIERESTRSHKKPSR